AAGPAATPAAASPRAASTAATAPSAPTRTRAGADGGFPWTERAGAAPRPSAGNLSEGEDQRDGSRTRHIRAAAEGPGPAPQGRRLGPVERGPAADRGGGQRQPVQRPLAPGRPRHRQLRARNDDQPAGERPGHAGGDRRGPGAPRPGTLRPV